MKSEQTLVSDLVDRGEPLAERSQAYNCYLEVLPDWHEARIMWVEPLRFHAEYNGPKGPDGYGAGERDDWSKHVDEDGYLTPDAESALAERLSTMFPKSVTGVSILTDWEDIEEPAIRFEFATTYEDGETFDHWYDRIGWPIVATMINVTDPGTFMSPYLFDMGSLS